MTSAGQITATRSLPYFVLIDKALRDEGTSGNYLPPDDYAAVDASLLELFTQAPALRPLDLEIGATWTTDAPFRETTSAIERCRELGILGVEMEAAALYAFAKAVGKPVICLAHMTNQMATIAGDFDKGAANGSEDALEVIASVASVWRQSRDSARPLEVQ
jgi:purine-nucleoside phosphorylase